VRDAALRRREPHTVDDRQQLFMHTVTLWQVFIQLHGWGVPRGRNRANVPLWPAPASRRAVWGSTGISPHL
jgi:hypothetical protein